MVKRKPVDDGYYNHITNNSKNLLFVHVPKCAGLTLRETFRCRGSGHRRAVHILGKDGRTQNKYRGYRSVASIRNPWDRLVSLYRYYRGRKDIHSPWEVLKKYKNFEEFVLDLKNIPISHQRGLVAGASSKKDSPYFGEMLQDNFNSCAYFVCDDDNSLLIDEIIEFDNLKEDVTRVQKSFDIQTSIPHKNKSKPEQGSRDTEGKHKAHYTNDALIQSVADVYHRDIEVFNYAF